MWMQQPTPTPSWAELSWEQAELHSGWAELSADLAELSQAKLSWAKPSWAEPSWAELSRAELSQAECRLSLGCSVNQRLCFCCMWTWPSQAGGCIFSSLHRVAHSTEHATLPFRIQCNTYRSPLLFHVPQFPCHTLSFHTGKTKTVTGRKKGVKKTKHTTHIQKETHSKGVGSSRAEHNANNPDLQQSTLPICSKVHCWFAAEHIADLQQSTLLICSRAHCWFAAEHIADLQQSTLPICSRAHCWFAAEYNAVLQPMFCTHMVQGQPPEQSENNSSMDCKAAPVFFLFISTNILSRAERERERVCVCVWIYVCARACMRERDRERARTCSQNPN